MTDFPFDLVYKHFAGPLLMKKLPHQQIDPMIYMVGVSGGELEFAKPIPVYMTNMFFGAPGGKDALGRFLNDVLGDKRHFDSTDGGNNCIVVISEAYMKFANLNGKKLNKKELLKDSLADDPDASDCIMIAIYRPGITRIGALRVNHDRSVTWSDMLPYEGLEGRLSGKPDDEAASANRQH